MNFNIRQLFKGKDEFAVSVIFPDAEINGFLPKFVSSYALKSYGIPVDGQTALKLIESLSKKIAGGVGVNGTLTLTENIIEFKPNLLGFLVSDGFQMISIPTHDIIAVKRDSFLLIGETIVVETVNGSIKLFVEGDINIKYFNTTTNELFSRLKKY